MTLMDSTFSYASAPRDSEMRALDHVREVYGMRQLTFDEREHSIRVEYDASRLTEDDVAALLRAAGISLQVNGIASTHDNNQRPSYERTRDYLARF
jgi:hypothetical protein